MNQSTYNHAQHTHSADGRCKQLPTFAESMVVFVRKYQEYCHDGIKPRYAGASIYPVYEIINSNREMLYGES